MRTKLSFLAVFGLLLVAVAGNVAAGDFLFAPLRGAAGEMDTIAAGQRMTPMRLTQPGELIFAGMGRGVQSLRLARAAGAIPGDRTAIKVAGYGGAIAGIGLLATNAIRHAGGGIKKIQEGDTWGGIQEIGRAAIRGAQAGRVFHAASKSLTPRNRPVQNITHDELVNNWRNNNSAFVQEAPVGKLGEIKMVGGQPIRVLETGGDVQITAGTQGIRNMMSQVSAGTGREVALLRMKDGTRILRMGEAGFVPVGDNAKRVIAHTHPSGRLAFSDFDYRVLQRLGQHSSVVIDPIADIAVRIVSLFPK